MLVAPYVGAWIETAKSHQVECAVNVAPYVGAWIETSFLLYRLIHSKSHPTWVRGLKLEHKHYHKYDLQVAPYVGAWIETIIMPISRAAWVVAPYVGAWIETTYELTVETDKGGRTLRGCVD